MADSSTFTAYSDTGETLRGLSLSEVNERIAEGRVNGDVGVHTKTVGRIVSDNLFTAFHALNLALAVIVLIAGSVKNALFMGVVFCNAAIGIIQELRAKRLMDKLSLVTAPTVTVIRNGEPHRIKKSEIVADELMRLHTGDQVCCDSVIVSGSCEADESLITGEADPISRDAGSELTSGSFLVSGSCYAKAVHIAEENYAAQITKQAGYIKHADSEIINSTKKIIRFIGLAVIPIGLALFAKQYFVSGIDFSQSAISTVAALVGMIPEGLVLLTSVVLAVSTIRLAARGALVQELYSVEMLARVDTLCLDKTGTITEGKMCVTKCLPLAGHTESEVISAARAIVCNLEDDNATAAAIRSAYEGDTACAQARIPFSSDRKWSAVTVDGVTYAMGAAQYMLRSVPQEISAAKGRGRVITIARADGSVKAGALPETVSPIGCLILSDVIRSSAAETLAYFAEEGVDIKIISGDDPETVSQIAQRVGIADAENYVDLTGLSEDEVTDAALRYKIFGRVRPEQKLHLIQALKAAGRTVAMTGDGVNDVMALKESDCSIAMAQGSDAARNVSQIILLSSDFAALPSIVAEGRRSINNLQRSSTLFITKTLFALITALMFIFLAAGYPLLPIQLTLISTLTIGAPSFVLALLPNAERVQGHFLSNVIRKAIPGGLTEVCGVILAAILCHAYGLGSLQISALCVLMVGFVSFMVLLTVSYPLNAIKTALILAVLCAFTGAVRFFPDFFEYYMPGGMTVILLICLAALTAIYVVFRYIVEKICNIVFRP